MRALKGRTPTGPGIGYPDLLIILLLYILYIYTHTLNPGPEANGPNKQGFWISALDWVTRGKKEPKDSISMYAIMLYRIGSAVSKGTRAPISYVKPST